MTYTESGLALLAGAVAEGMQIQFSRVELVADPERSAGALTYLADISSVSVINNTTILLKAVADNYGFAEDYYFNQINIYAVGPDGVEILFCFQRSTTCPFYIPAFDGRPVQNEINIYVTVASTDAVKLEIDGAFLLRTDFEDYFNDLSSALLNLDVIEQMWRKVYFTDPTALTSEDIEEATKTQWDGTSSEDEEAMTAIDVEEATGTQWDGTSSEDEEAMTAADIKEATQ